MKKRIRNCGAVFVMSFISLWLTGGESREAWGQQVVPPPGLVPLNQVPVPEPPNLFQFVSNKPAAIRLGKALFWDMQVGSDGVQACGTCHFSAGADSRMKNQLSPGLNAGDSVFGNNTSGAPGYPQFGPNYTLQPDDFPLHKRAAPADSQDSPILQDTNDVVSSQGVRLSQFRDVVPGSSEDLVDPISDPVFNVGGVNTRRVEPRNAPTVVNAVFNFSNFWDGRANFRFNGATPFGPLDQSAGVWFNDPTQGLVKRPVAIEFASLASQAVGPPTSEFEMSARGRTFPLLGRKMLSLTPLGKQLVHPGDSVLGTLSRAAVASDGTLTGGRGLDTTYGQMIQAAFQRNLWDSPDLTPEGFSQMEANFSLFFGMAVQLYEATLVSDQTPFDAFLGGDQTALTAQEQRGFSLFEGVANCAACHGDAETTEASVGKAKFINNADNRLFEQMFTADGTQVVYDTGFNNTAVTPTTDDLVRGGTAPFVNPSTGANYPLSFTALAELQAQNLLPFPTPMMPPGFPTNSVVNSHGTFKIPGLRNVELTAPYFHNGSVLTLDDVVDFYVRGGNFPADNMADLDPVILPGIPQLRGNAADKAALVAFLKTLTDPRVKNASAPFDHPEIFVPEGDPEVLTRIAATDANGNAPLVPPLAPIITSNPVTGATVGEAYGYDVHAFDPNGDALTYGLVAMPGGMTIDAATGRIDWMPTADQTGPNTVTIRVQDPGGLSAEQSFVVTVENTPPSALGQPTAPAGTTGSDGASGTTGSAAAPASKTGGCSLIP